MSRKFLVSIAGLIVSIYALAVDNTLVAIAGIVLAGCFVIGESIVDAHSCVKQSKTVDLTEYHQVNHEVEKDAKRD